LKFLKRNIRWENLGYFNAFMLCDDERFTENAEQEQVTFLLLNFYN